MGRGLSVLESLWCAIEDSPKLMLGRTALKTTIEPAGDDLDSDWFGAAWGRANARWHLWQFEATNEAFTFEADQLLEVATLVAAEFEVSRSPDSIVFR